MDNNKIIIVDNLVKDYSMGSSFFRALNNISLLAKKGEFTGLVGPSGSGKTTLLNILGALDNPTQEDAVVLGKSVKSLSHKDAARLRNNSIGFIFQTYNLLPVYTVFENVEFPLLLLKKGKEEREEAVMKALSWVGLTNKANSRPNQLSGDPEFVFRNHAYLFKDINDNLNRKKISSALMYILLLSMALLAVFDTQVLAIFRRRKEIGTLMALGMTRWNIINLFTLEGSLLGTLAFVSGMIYGVPLLDFLAKTGVGLPSMVQSVGSSIPTTLYPKYGIRLYIITTMILFISVIIVSFLPTRRITKLKPTDALRGKLS